MAMAWLTMDDEWQPSQMGDAGFMISSMMNASYQNPVAAGFSIEAPCRSSFTSYSPTESEGSFYLDQQPPPPHIIAGSTAMPGISNGYPGIAGGSATEAQPQLRIIEEPVSRIRYRYASEKGAHGGMHGCNSTPGKKTNPQVKLENAPSREVYVQASLYTNEENPKRHVHKLTGKQCTNGICELRLDEDNVATLPNLGVLFTGKKDVPKVLFERYRQANYVPDPNFLKEEVEREAKAMNLNSVCICFQAFDAEKRPICSPVFSAPVQNQKSPESGELRITKMSRCSGACTGDDEVFLLCEKVNKKDIKIKFFEERDGKVIWEKDALFNETDVHHQVAIVFRTPEYRDDKIQQPVTVALQLYRPKDSEVSEPFPFIYRPVDKDQERVSQKRKKVDCEDSQNFCSQSQYQQPSPSFDRMRNSPRMHMPYGSGQLHGSPTYQARGSTQPPVSESDTEDISDLMVFNPSPTAVNDVSSTTTETVAPMVTIALQIVSPVQQEMLESSNAFSAASSTFVASNVQEPVHIESVLSPMSPFNETLPSEGERSPVLLHNDAFMGWDSTLRVTNEANSSSHFQFDSISRDESFDTQPRRKFTSGIRGNRQSPPERKNQIECQSMRSSGSADNVRLPYDGNFSRSYPVAKPTPPLSASTRDIVRHVAKTLCRFLALGNIHFLLHPLREYLGLTDDDGDNAVHHIALSENSVEFVVKGSLESLRYLPLNVINQTNNHFQTPLQLAVAFRKLEVVKQLLRCGANPNIQDFRGSTAVHLAVLKHHHDYLDALLTHREMLTRPDLDLLNYNGYSPLHLAILERCGECVRKLCSCRGIDVNVKDGTSGRTALHIAVEHSSELVDILLMQDNIEIDAQDYAGNTALHLACGSGNADIALKLMVKEANPLIENFLRSSGDESDDDENCGNCGKTPFDLAEGNQRLKSILAGIDPSLVEESKVEKVLDMHSDSTCIWEDDSNSARFSSDRSIGKVHHSDKISAAELGDSGFISGEIKAHSKEGIERLCQLFDPPSKDWEKLAEVCCDMEIITSLRKETSPTSLIIKTLIKEENLEEMLIIANLQEHIPILRQENV